MADTDAQDHTDDSGDEGYARNFAKAAEPIREPAAPDLSAVRIEPVAAEPSRPPKRPAPPTNQRVHDLSAWLTDVERRQKSGQRIPPPKPIQDVLGGFTGAPSAQTRIQVLAAAAAARHLEGEHSDNARRLQRLVDSNDNRVRALREHSHRSEALAHGDRGTQKGEIEALDQNRVERDAREDRRIFDAAAAVSLGYVAAKGLPAYDALARRSEAQLGPEPESAAPRTEAPTPVRGGAEQMKHTLDTVGRGLAQAAGPLAGDDDVAANMAPVNVAQVNEELTNLIAPALRAAMSSHPRKIKDLLNAEQTPDEENEHYFEQEPVLEHATERTAAPTP